MTYKEFQKKLNDDNRIQKVNASSLIRIFDEMVKKYNLHNFVKQVVASGQNQFSAILPFISDPDDRSRYTINFSANFH